jgi:hypothetical protein
MMMIEAALVKYQAMIEKQSVMMTHQSLVNKKLTVEEHRAAKDEYLQNRVIMVARMM